MFFTTLVDGSMKDEPFQHHYLHHRQQQQQQQQPPPPPQRSLSDEVDSSKSSGENKRIKVDEPKDKDRAGSTIEVTKRPRGRPPGSRNKPKIPVAITRDEELSSAMCPHVLEIPSGHDVVDSLAGFSRRRNLGVSVLSGTGAVANVTLRQPQLGGAASASTIAFRGHFEILSISATFLPPAIEALSSASGAVGGLISISLAGPQGQVVGGIVAGPLVAAGTVVIVAAAFANPSFHRLPPADDASVSISVSGDMEDHEQNTYAQRRHQGPVDAVSAAAAAAAEPTGLSIYGSHAASDVIWAPMARPPQPPTF